MKRSMTTAGKKTTKGRCKRSSVPSKSSTRVVSASTITTFIMETPRRNIFIAMGVCIVLALLAEIFLRELFMTPGAVMP